MRFGTATITAAVGAALLSLPAKGEKLLASAGMLEHVSSIAIAPPENHWTPIDNSANLVCNETSGCTVVTNVDVVFTTDTFNEVAVCTYIDGVAMSGCDYTTEVVSSRPSVHAHQSAQIAQGTHKIVTKVMLTSSGTVVRYLCDYGLYF